MLGTVLPAIFLGVAAFLLNVVISRLVATQREQIAALKALGYPNRAIAGALPEDGGRDRRARLRARHRARALAGQLVHWCCTPSSSASRCSSTGSRPGWWRSRSALTLATAVVGHAERHRRHRAPGAGRGDAPAGARPLPAHAGRAAGHHGHGHLAAHDPAQHGAQAAAHAGCRSAAWRSSVAIVVMGNFFRDAIEYVVDSQFHVAMRSDVAVWLLGARARQRAPRAARACPACWPPSRTRYVPVRWSTATAASASRSAAWPTCREL